MNKRSVYGNNMSRRSVFFWRMKKRAGEVCSVFDIGDFWRCLIK